MSSSSDVGKIAWHDLTVDNAEEVKDFYASVVGWDTGAVSMPDNDQSGGDYQDFNMNLPGSVDTVAGVCHARGSNNKLPPQWIMYVAVQNAQASAEKCIKLGGEIVDGPRNMGDDVYYYIKDPAGATLAIYSSAVKE